MNSEFHLAFKGARGSISHQLIVSQTCHVPTQQEDGNQKDESAHLMPVGFFYTQTHTQVMQAAWMCDLCQFHCKSSQNDKAKPLIWLPRAMSQSLGA